MDENVVVPYGCMDCSTLLVYLPDGECPHCGSTDVLSMQDILALAIEYRSFSEELGLDEYN